MDECKPLILGPTGVVPTTRNLGVTKLALLELLAGTYTHALKRFLWDRRCVKWLYRGCLGGGRGIRGCVGCIMCQKRLTLS